MTLAENIQDGLANANEVIENVKERCDTHKSKTTRIVFLEELITQLKVLQERTIRNK